MKLNYKRTILVGFAFFLICAFWQAYDNTIPLILTNKFGMSQTWSGVIMALDNVLALFLLPLFGAISDRSHSKKGRRTPFIVVGTLIAAVALMGLSFVDMAQLNNIKDVSSIDDPAALVTIYEKEKDEILLTPDGVKFTLAEKFTQEEFAAIRSQTQEGEKTLTNPDYTNYVVPARQAYAWQVTAESPVTLVFFVALLLVVLVSMATFRSPAVALMPDVTVKPLRSKANAVINLMGSAGGILVLILGMVFATSAVKNSLMSYTLYFSVIAGIMLVEMDNGALFRISGSSYLAPHENWYRLSCIDGGTELIRGHKEKLVRLAYNSWAVPEGCEEEKIYEAVFESNAEEASHCGHAGSDYFVTRAFVEAVRDGKPFFADVYQATAMSATAIMGWRSVLEDSRQLDIPDFRKESDRALYENDTLTPFPAEGKPNSLPYSTVPVEELLGKDRGNEN